MPGGSKKGGGLEVKSAYKMKYQGNNSAFPFKSPLKDKQTKMVEVDVKHKHGGKPLGRSKDADVMEKSEPKEKNKN